MLTCCCWLDVFILVIISRGVTSQTIQECPEVCSCRWSGGKQTAECSGASLASIPLGINPETQVLNVTGNVMQSIGPKEFYRAGLTNLQRIYASRCGLLHLAEDSFYMLTNLIELDLSHNFLSEVPSQALSDCNALRRLSLSFNPIQRLNDGSFKGLKKLGTLELNNCQLHTIETNAFDGLKQLEFLRLTNNNLQILPSAAIIGLSQPLYGLNLEENPWMCDCQMRDLRIWMLEHNIPLSLSPKCSSPERLNGVSWSALDVDDFACKPEMITTSGHVEAVESDNATLRCEVDSVPHAEITWYFKSRSIQNLSLMSFGRQMYYIRDDTSFSSKVSLLTIINVLSKDTGRYVCVGANRAGNVSGNVTLAVFPRIHEFNPLTNGEVIAIGIGLIFLLLILLGAVLVIIAQHRKYMSHRTATSYNAKLVDNVHKCDSVTTFKNNTNSSKNVYTKVVTDADRNCASNNIDLVSSFQKTMNNMQRRDSNEEESLCNTAMLDTPGSSSSSRNSSESDKKNTPLESSKTPDIDMPTTSIASTFLHSSLLPSNTEKLFATRSPLTGRNNFISASSVAEDADEDDLVPAPAPKSSAKEIMDAVHKELQLRQQQLRATAVLAHRVIDNQRLRRESADTDFHQQHLSTLNRSNQSNKVISNPMYNIALSPESRDSPDEGLGDEREYETDILE